MAQPTYSISLFKPQRFAELDAGIFVVRLVQPDLYDPLDLFALNTQPLGSDQHIGSFFKPTSWGSIYRPLNVGSREYVTSLITMYVTIFMQSVMVSFP